jgi:pimeloyl-ACP methyl ester carboxylesterase
MGTTMINLRTYGNQPYAVALIHGGPGAVGEMEPVARELATDFGVLEPIQTETTIDGQVEELKVTLEAHTDQPVMLVGFSWGAWLSTIVTAKYSQLVKKLILVGSGPYEPQYLSQIGKTRVSRLTQAEQEEYDSIIALLNDPDGKEKSEKFARLGQLAAKTDRFDAVDIPYTRPDLGVAAGNQFHGVLKEAHKMRTDGRLLAFADQIRCPVLAIHGNYDPHPAAGVQKPLSVRLEHFRFILLENCGHKPWIERQTKDKFYEILRQEINAA